MIKMTEEHKPEHPVHGTEHKQEHKEHGDHKPEHGQHTEHKAEHPVHADHKEHESLTEHKNETSAHSPSDGRRMSDRVGSVILAVIGVIVGYLSFLINRPLYSLGLAIVVLIIIYVAFTKVLKLAEPKKWWANKAILYIFMWLVIWAIFFNVYIVKAL